MVIRPYPCTGVLICHKILPIGILHFPCLTIDHCRKLLFRFRACERRVRHDCRAIFVEFSEELLEVTSNYLCDPGF